MRNKDTHETGDAAQVSSEAGTAKDQMQMKLWMKPTFKDIRLGFEITMYFWTK